MILLYDISYRLYYWIKRIRKRIPKLEPICRRCEDYCRLFMNRKMILWLENHPVKWGLNTKKRKESYTISLTTFPARIHYVHIAIETLMRQSFKPDRIVLWLAESQFPDRKLPEKLTALQDKGLTIRFCDDLRSHKKYFYAFQEYPDDNIILADDDFFYSRDMVKRLCRMHKERPNDIVAESGLLITPMLTSLPSQWEAPKQRKRYVSCMKVQAYTGGGSLFPARWYSYEVFNKEKAMGIAGTADDLWLKAMSLMSGTKTTLLYPMRGFPILIQIENNQSLYTLNNADGENMNDKIWKSLVEEYKLDTLEIDEDCKALL